MEFRYNEVGWTWNANLQGEAESVKAAASDAVLGSIVWPRPDRGTTLNSGGVSWSCKILILFIILVLLVWRPCLGHVTVSHHTCWAFYFTCRVVYKGLEKIVWQWLGLFGKKNLLNVCTHANKDFIQLLLGAVHNLCHLKIGDFWPPFPFCRVYLQNGFF